MSLLSNQVDDLRTLADREASFQTQMILRNAADTIETLSAKVRAQNLGGDMIYIEDLGAVYDEIEKNGKRSLRNCAQVIT